MVQVVEGGYFRLRNGVVKGPARGVTSIDQYSFDIDGRRYTPTGTCDDVASFDAMTHALAPESERAKTPGAVETSEGDPTKLMESRTATYRSASPAGEPRNLRVSLWCGFAQLIAEVTVSEGGDVVTVNHAWLEPGGVHSKIGVEVSDLRRLAIVRSIGAVPFLAAIEARAREEAFA